MTLHLLYSSSLPSPLTSNNNSYKEHKKNIILQVTSTPSYLTNLRYFQYGRYNINIKRLYHLTCTISSNQNKVAEDAESPSSRMDSELLDGRLLSDVSAAKDANQVLDMIALKTNRISGTLSNSDCGLIISAALDRKNADLALSVFSSMRSSFDPVGGDNTRVIERWRWSRPDVGTYKLLAQGLAASLRVADALKIIGYVCRVGASPGEEVSFGKVINCPSCKVAVAVAQPQHGIQACTFIGNIFIAFGVQLYMGSKSYSS